MARRPRFTHAALLSLFALAIDGCAPSEGGDDDIGLRGAAAEAEVYGVFPAVRQRWMEWPYRFDGRRGSTGKEVFATPSSDLPKAIVVEVPAVAGEPVVVRGDDGFSIKVWDDARRGSAELTASGLTYGRTGGGTSFWTARESGAEEWLYLPDGATSLEIARYGIEGGRPQQHEWAIDVYDDAGTPRVTITAPQVFATDGQRVDAKMVLDGDEAAVVLTRKVDGPLLVDPVFVAAGSMSGDRNWHDAIMLSSGRVMVLGGYSQINGGSMDLATMELFDPSTNTWTNGPSAAAPRLYPTMTILTDGRLLVVSETLIGQQPATQIFDEQGGTWSTPAQPADERVKHQAVRLPDGRVLVVGGSRVGSKVEIYDPNLDAWTAAAPTNAVQVDRTLQLLPSGDAMVVGGKVAEVYSPASNAWSLRAVPTYQHSHDGVVALAGGKFVATGGTLIGSGIAWGRGTEMYDSVTDTWTVLAQTSIQRSYVPVTQAADGSLFLAGGHDNFMTTFGSTEIYDFGTNTWSLGPPLLTKRIGHTQTTLLDGRILVAGGHDGNNSLASAELLTGLQGLGVPCSSALDCASSFCADGVCCNEACADLCQACSQVAGGSQDGTCGPEAGGACDDGNLCTSSDICTAGTCTGTTKVCPSNPAECFGPSACDSATGNCVSLPLPDGSPCVGGTCVGSLCVSSSASAGGAGGAEGSGGSGGGAGDGGEGGGTSVGVGGGGAGGMGAGTGSSGGAGGTGDGGQGGLSESTSSAGTASTSVSASSSGAASASGDVPLEGESGGCDCAIKARERYSLDAATLPLALGALLLCRRRRASRTTQRPGSNRREVGGAADVEPT